jgi:branched-chain amino acid aminotransferase
LENYISHNGNIVLSDTPLFTHKNRAFAYGDGLFESMRLHDQKILFYDSHYERLKRGMEILKMHPPAGIDKAFFLDVCIELAEKNKIEKDGRIRLELYRNEGGFYAPLSNEASFVISISPIEDFGFRLNERGLRIDIFDTLRKAGGILSGIKSSSALLYVISGLEAREKNADECILLNEAGGIAETTKSNIFMVKDGAFYTPSLSEGGLAGVMREQLIHLLHEEGKKVVERRILPSEIESFDEIFLSNAIRGIEWVVAYRNKRYYNKHADWLLKKLNTRISRDE